MLGGHDSSLALVTPHPERLITVRPLSQRVLHPAVNKKLSQVGCMKHIYCISWKADHYYFSLHKKTAHFLQMFYVMFMF